MSYLVFVYGTLKNGHRRHHVLQNERFIGVANTTPEYKIYPYGGYPALVKESNDGIRIYGELYEVGDSCVIELDKIECVDNGLFVRKDVSIENFNLVNLPIYKNSSLKLFSNSAFAYFFVNVERLSKLKDCGNNWTLN